MRGEGVIPKSATVNVSYNGSTVNMGGAITSSVMTFLAC